MTSVHFPEGFQLERLRREHPRRPFRSSEPETGRQLEAMMSPSSD